MRFLNQISRLVGVGILATGCGELPGFRVNEKSDVFSQVAVRNDKVDILFVIDNSGSMAGEQAIVANSFSEFINKFVTKRLDFHVGVISTDALENPSYWSNSGNPYGNFFNGGPGTLLSRKPSNDRFLTKNSQNLVGQFTQNVQIGINGNGAETPFLSILRFLQADRLGEGAWNQGFLRDEAFLSVIIISDEDESISATSTAYLTSNTTSWNARHDQTKQALLALKPTKQEYVRVDGIVTIDNNPSLCPAGYSFFVSEARAIKRLVDELGGTNSRVCDNFAPALEGLGDNLVQLLSRFKLLQPPTDGIIVRVDGVEVPQDAINGWVYIPETMEVEFRGTAIPAANAKISVTYTPSRPIL
jgi:hypothetical protein